MDGSSCDPLSPKVVRHTADTNDVIANGTSVGLGAEEVGVEEKLSYWLSPLLIFLSILHFFASVFALVGYGMLKVSPPHSTSASLAILLFPFFMLYYSNVMLTAPGTFKSGLMETSAVQLSSFNYVVLMLQVPLVLFKREKKIAHQIVFTGKWIVEKPGMWDFEDRWDAIVLSSKWVL